MQPELPEALWSEVRAAYQTPPRAYHNETHLDEIIGHFDLVDRESLWKQPREVFSAMLFHDAIYEAGSKDNEARSAELAADCISRHLPDANLDLETVKEMILLTAKHGTLSREGLDEDTRLFLDCDMAILASSPARFVEYDAQIAEEYRHIPTELYQLGRKSFFEHLLARDRIYLSDFFYERLEKDARNNITSWIESTTETSIEPKGTTHE